MLHERFIPAVAYLGSSDQAQPPTQHPDPHKNCTGKGGGHTHCEKCPMSQHPGLHTAPAQTSTVETEMSQQDKTFISLRFNDRMGNRHL